MAAIAATIPRRIPHEDSAQAGLPVVALEPERVAAEEYLALAEEMLARVNA